MKKIKAAILIFDAMAGLLLFWLAAGRMSGEFRSPGGENAWGVSVAYRDPEGKWGAVDRIKDGLGKQAEKVTGADSAEKKKIALTFDDGPHPYYTEQLLDGLRERGVRATFFVTGEHAALHPDVILRMRDEGHMIGNHTYSHIQLRKNNREEFRRELLKTNEVLEGITGEEVVYVRPPYGSWDKSFERELNMFPVLWTVDPLDWSSRDVDSITKKVLAKAGEDDIILLHDYYETSVTAALRIVDELLEEGYTFVTVEEILFD